MIDLDHLRQWIGRSSRERDVAAAAPLAGLAAMLDYDRPPWPEGEVPPLGHWLYFLPRARQSQISEDGHPQRGGMLPPVPLPRRMWAAGTVTFHHPLTIGDMIERQSTVQDVTAKTGSSGELVFVTVKHELFDSTGTLCIEERQDLVYRGETTSTPIPSSPRTIPDPEDKGAAQHIVRPDPVMLFRYSALTFNGHRIHYDRDYARDVEGYPGLVVHGPLSATLLIDHFLSETPDTRIASFEFRAQRPLFDTASFTLHFDRTDGGAQLWTAGPEGQPAMKASLKTR